MTRKNVSETKKNAVSDTRFFLNFKKPQIELFKGVFKIYSKFRSNLSKLL